MATKSLFFTSVVKHTTEGKSTMGKGHGGKLANMSDVCDRIFQRLNLLRGQDPEGENGKYIQARLAEYVDASESAVSQWKHGSTVYPRPHNLCLAAQYLKTTEWWLTFGNDRKRKDPRCDSEGNILEVAKTGPTGAFPPPYPYPPESLELMEAAEPLAHEDRRRLKAVAYAFAHRCGDWDGAERRRPVPPA